MKQTKKSDGDRLDCPAFTPEARELQLIAKAERLAEKKIDDGTASSDLIKSILKREGKKAELEIQILEKQRELLAAKTEQIKSSIKIESLFEDAMAMFKKYNGSDDTYD